MAVPGTRSVTLLVLVLLAGLASGCTSANGPDPSSEETSDKCRPGVFAAVVEEVEFHPTDEGGPNVDRVLRVTRNRQGGPRCVVIAVDHADPDPRVVRYRLDVQTPDGELTRRGKDPSDMVPLRVDIPGCITATAQQWILGGDDKEHRYDARLQAGCRPE